MKTSMNHLVRRHSGSRRAFTLIELLIVIGLTAVLFALLLVPLVSAINYTRQAQIVTAAQDAARITRERLTRELSSAMYVFDGTSHPFLVPAGTPPTQSDDRYTNFLDLQVPTSNQSGGKYLNTVAHAYAAKLDFTLPRTVDNAAAVHDPTTIISPSVTRPNDGGDPISYRQTDNGSAVVSDPAYIFPLAAGTTMIRYWVGLKDPTKPYNNTHEGKFNDNSDNTYILYRAQFQPYTIDAVTKLPTPNTVLFATRQKRDNAGNLVSNGGNPVMIPELDDPDFFRYVSPTDVNWLDDVGNHGAFGAQTPDTPGVTLDGTPAQHNIRVDRWAQIAKPVIPGPNIDLILLPHNTDNTLMYDSATGAFPGVPHTGLANDPVTGKKYPIVNTSVTFRAATVSGDAVPGTTTDYGSAGLPSVSGESGYTYVPTYYTAANRSWTLPFHVSVYPGNYASLSAANQYYFDTQIASGTDTTAPNPLYVAGDLLEYKNDGSSTKLVYNITRAFPLTTSGGTTTLTGTDYVPMTVNPDNGTISFGTPSLPNGPIDRNSRNWNYIYDVTADTDILGGVNPNGMIDLTKQGQAATASPLTNPALPPASAPNVRNAHVIPGGIRIYGPDLTPGPNLGLTVPYTEVNSVTEIGANQYHLDYSKNALSLSTLPGSTLTYLQANPSAKIAVVYDYQANLTLADPTKGYSYGVAGVPDNLYQPMQVKVDYQTRDVIDVNIGVRLYDLSSGRAQVIPAQTKIKIGNSNR
jgi:prepilin-type N-terminal cleavage/methylation domain-containing protein